MKMEKTDNACEIESRLIFSPTILKLQNYAVDISSDGKVFVVGHGRVVTIYNTLSCDKLNCFTTGTAIQKIKLSTGSTYVACQTYENKRMEVLIFNIKESSLHVTLKSDDNFSSLKYASIFWSPMSKFLWTSWNANYQTCIVAVDKKENFDFCGSKLNSLNKPLCCFSPDENYYITIQRTLPPTLIFYTTNGFIELKVIYLENLNDVNGLTALPDYRFCLWDSPLQMNFHIWSLDGKLQHTIESDLSEYGVRQVSFSPCGRLVAIMQFRKTEAVVYDTLTRNLVAVLNHDMTEHKHIKAVVLNKTDFSKNCFNKSNVFNWQMFSANHDKNSCIELNNNSTNKPTVSNNTAKGIRKRFIQFSSCGQFIATYEPIFSDRIWIWNLHAHNLLEAILVIDGVETNSLPDIKWHGCKPYLAADIGTDIVIWNHETQFAYRINSNLNKPMKSLWCNLQKMYLAVYTSDSLCFAF